MDKRSKLVKIIEGVGHKATPSDVDIPKKVLMKFEDGNTGKTKCAAFVEIADTDFLRRKGLSKRASLGRSEGMYFDCKGPFWMKDVEFPLDLCYLDESGMVTEKVAMAKDKTGSTLYPRKNMESIQAIELPAGYCSEHGIKIGDVLVPMMRID